MNSETQTSARDFVSEFLRLVDEGWEPELQEFLKRVPEDLREAVFAQIDPELEERAVWPELERYRVRRDLGRGSLGSAYLAVDLETGEQSVLKLVASGHDPERLARWFDVERAESGCIVVQPYVEGTPFPRGTADVSLLLKLARQIEAEQPHLNLKPNNVIVNDEGDPVLLDQGVGAAVLSLPPDRAPLAGLPHFESPEHASRTRLTAASDVFSFGSLMYVGLSGNLPFPGGAPEKIRERIAIAEPAPGLPHQLQDICFACLARRPSDRPSMTVVVEELKRFIAGDPVRLRPPAYRETLRKRVREVTAEVRSWELQGLADGAESDRVETICRSILAREEQWTDDPTRAPKRIRLLPVGAIFFATASAILVRFGVAHVSAMAWIGPLAVAFAMLGVGAAVAVRGERHVARPLLAGGLVALLPALAAMFQSGALFLGDSMAFPGLSWFQVAVAANVVLLGSIGLLYWRREQVFAWCAAGALLLGFTGSMGAFDFFGLGFGILVLLALSLSVARQLEAHDLFAWARPFYVLGYAACIGVPIAVALSDLTALAAPIALSGFGFVFMGVSWAFARSTTAGLRRAARHLQVWAPGLAVGGLAWHAAATGYPVWGGIAMTVSFGMATFGVIGQSRSALRWGLASLVATTAMPALLGLVSPALFATIVGVGGAALCAFTAWDSLRRTVR